MTAGLRRLPRRVWDRGGVELGVVAVALALLAGTVVGTGSAGAVADVTDGLTWLGDDDRGQVVQVDPVTGRPLDRLQVSGPGGRLALSQTDGHLVVNDLATGKLTSIDLATLLASGRRQGAADGRTKVLVGGGLFFLADLDDGRVRRVDPLTLAGIGEPLEGGVLADAVVDEEGTVWAAGEDGRVRGARWSEQAGRFVVELDREVAGGGRGSALVPHERGATVFGAQGGVVVQLGDRDGVSAAVPGLRGEVLAALTSPRALVPVAVPSTSSVVLLAGTTVVETRLDVVGCERPGRPVVFSELVHVPCEGAGKVVVLDRRGQRARPDLRTADGRDPQLVVDDGRLLLSTAGGDRAVVVERDGSNRVITTRDPAAPVQDPGRVPAAVVPPPLPPALQPPTPDVPEAPDPPDAPETPETPDAEDPAGPSGAPEDPQAPVLPGQPGAPGGPPTTGPGVPGRPAPSPVVLDAPVGVTARAVGTGSLQVGWEPGASGADTWTVVVDPSLPAQTVPGDRRTADVTGVPAGTYRVVVVAGRGGAQAPSAPAAPVAVAGAPAPPPTAPPTTAPPAPPAPAPTAAPPGPAPAPPPAPGPTTPPPAPAPAPEPTPPPPPPPPVPTPVEPSPQPTTVPPPAAGDTVVTEVSWRAPSQYDPEIPVLVNLAPPAGWSLVAGDCQLVVSGGGLSERIALPCSTSGERYVGGSRGGGVTAYVQAPDGTQSAAVTGYVPNRNEFAYCERPGGICTLPVVSPVGDDPSPTYPAVVLLGGAAVLNVLRTRGARLRAALTRGSHA